MTEEAMSQADGDLSQVDDVNETGAEAPAADVQATEPKSFDAEYVQRLRQEAAYYRVRLRELEAKAQELKDAELREREQLQAKLAELERQHAEAQRLFQEDTLRYEVMLAANKLGVIDPDAAWRLLDQASIEYDEDGKPTNVTEALRELVKAKPYLVSQAVGVAPTNPARTPTVFKRSQLRDPAFFREHRDAIMEALRAGNIQED